MPENNELRTVASSIGSMMARAVGDDTPVPVVTMQNPSNMAAYMALAGAIATFEVPTLFGYDVRVTVSPAGGMFSGR
jgi:hypothetical protein